MTQALSRLSVSVLFLALLSALATQVARIWIEARVPQDGRQIDVGDSCLHAISLTFGTPFGLAVFKRSAAAVFAPEPLPADFATTGGGLLSLRPENSIAGSSDVRSLRAALPELSARYDQLEMHVDVLFGSDDQIVDKEWNGMWLTDQLANATYSEIEGGHLIPFSSPKKVADWITTVANRANSETAN